MNMKSFKAGARAALVAASLAASTVAAVAAPLPGPHVTIGGPAGAVSVWPGGVHLTFGTPDYFKRCLDDNGAIRLAQRNGFSHVQMSRHNSGDDGRNRVYLTGVKRFDFYVIRVDRCAKTLDAHKIGHNDKGDFSSFKPSNSWYW